MNGMILSHDGPLSASTVHDLVVDTQNPFWMCDLKANPKHFGIVKATVSVPAFGTKTLLSVNHFYTKEVPSFLAAWSYPVGTHPTSTFDNQTFGIGSFDVVVSPTVGVSFKASINSSQFTITARNDTSTAANNLYVEYRYYIFAQGWPPLVAL